MLALADSWHPVFVGKCLSTNPKLVASDGAKAGRGKGWVIFNCCHRSKSWIWKGQECKYGLVTLLCVQRNVSSETRCKSSCGSRLAGALKLCVSIKQGKTRL